MEETEKLLLEQHLFSTIITSVNTQKESPEDVLWRALLAWPEKPGKALLRASEVQELSKFDLRQPVLDFGCGDGEVTSLLEKKIDVGIDLNLSEIHRARATGTYGIVVNGNGEYLPFPSNYFATIICNSVIEHLKKLDPVLKETYRVLKPGGSLIFTTPGPQKQDYLFFSHVLGEVYRDRFNIYWQHINYHSLDKWQKILARAGFTNIQAGHYESPETSTLIDLLYSIRLQYVGLSESCLTLNQAREIWLKIIHRLLYPYFIAGAGKEGAGFVIKAEKPTCHDMQ